jgi:oligopeptide transport system substrate-binding protein
MKKIIALLLCVPMIFGLTACGGNSAPSGSSAAEGSTDGFVVTACIASEPETIDPGLISSVDGSTYVNHMF